MRELMAARRVRDRPRTHLAKQALGERGPAWHTVEGRRERLARMPGWLHALGLGPAPEPAATDAERRRPPP